MKNLQRLAPLMLLLLLASLRAQAESARGSFERTLSVTDTVELEVKTGSGNVVVRTGPSGSVAISAYIQARSRDGLSAAERVRRIEAAPPIVQTGNSIRIGYLEPNEYRQNVSIDYELTVPSRTRLVSRTGSGDQSVEGLVGPVKVDTGSGNLRLSDIGSELHASSGSGDIRLSGISGGAKVNTGSGNIHAEGIAGDFTASTGSGDLSLTQTAPGEVKVETGSGDVVLHGVNGQLRVETGNGDITAQGTMRGLWRVHTGSGSVRVQMPSGQAYDLDARSGAGKIHLHQPITMEGSISTSHIRGRVLGGGSLLELQTGSGDISLD